jgi:hypothetical protein
MKGLLKGAFPVLIAVAFAAAAASPADGEEVSLRYKFREGDVITMRLVEKTATSMMEMEIKQEQTRTFMYTVKKVEGGVAEMDVKISRIQMKAANPFTGDVEFDSDKDQEAPDNPQLALQAHLVGKTFTIKMDERGKILDVSGFTKIGDEIIKKMEESMGDDPQAAMQLAMLKGMLSDDAMKNQLCQGSAVLPEEPVKAGSEWKDEVALAMPMMGSIKTKTLYKVESIEGDMVKGKVEGSMETEEEKEGEDDEGDEEDPAGGMGGMVKISDGKVTGTFEFDTKVGQMKKKETVTKMKVTAMMGEMPMEITSILELVDVKPAGAKEEGGGKEEGDEGGF